MINSKTNKTEISSELSCNTFWYYQDIHFIINDIAQELIYECLEKSNDLRSGCPQRVIKTKYPAP